MSKGARQSKNGIKTHTRHVCLCTVRVHVVENSLEGHVTLTLTVSGGEIARSFIVFSLFICIF